MKAKTPDEKFILALFEMASELDDPRLPLNRYEVGKRVGLHPKGTNTICKLLMQANFIKKRGEDEIYLTDQGEVLAHRLLSE